MPPAGRRACSASGARAALELFLFLCTHTSFFCLGARSDDFQFQKFELGEVIEGSGTVAADGGDSTAAELAQVSFKVDFVQKGTLNLMVLNEKSTFRKDAESGKWLYSKGEVSYDAQAVSLTDEEKERLMEKQREVNEEKEKELKQKEILKVAEAHDPDRGLPRKPPQMKGKIGKQM